MKLYKLKNTPYAAILVQAETPELALERFKAYGIDLSWELDRNYDNACLGNPPAPSLITIDDIEEVPIDIVLYYTL